MPRYNPPGEKGGAIYAVDVTMDSTFVVTANADGSSARIANVWRRNAPWTGYHRSSLVIPFANLHTLHCFEVNPAWFWHVLTCLHFAEHPTEMPSGSRCVRTLTGRNVRTDADHWITATLRQSGVLQLPGRHGADHPAWRSSQVRGMEHAPQLQEVVVYLTWCSYT